MCLENDSTAETLMRDLTGMTCVTFSPISKLSATVEYLFESHRRRLTIEHDAFSWNSTWTAYDNRWPVLELEAMTLTALERWQERHIKRALSGYRPWKPERLMRALQAELLVAYSNNTPWQRLFR